MNPDTPYRCGYVALIGRPNAGKSTLLNRLVGEKLAITSRRPHTTRQQVLGIRTTPACQLIFIDTPGMHDSRQNSMNRYINRIARGALEGVDAIVVLITPRGWTDTDKTILQAALKENVPVIIAINKVDTLEDRDALLPLIAESSAMPGADVIQDIIPISALRGENLDRLEKLLMRQLPEQPAVFPEDQLTDRTDRFMASEYIREQVFRQLGQEVPHAAAVSIESYAEEKKLIRIEAIIWVEREGQKAIVIGKKGQRMKDIGSEARKQLEAFLGKKVFLQLWVKVRENWRDNEMMLRNLGFGED
ncbi:MAG: GTPase Era [Gammaproteobacteria bacterium]|nr:GTPase Era [Gammaproteobacteria bacterium]